jgi:hypothetical protein
MRQFIFNLVLIGIVFFCSCQNQPELESASNFYRDFNLGEIIEEMNVPELQSSGSLGSSRQSTGETTDYRRNFSLIYEIKEQDGKRFDEEKFFNEFKSEIAKKISENGIRINSTGSNDGNFYFNYSKDKNKGWLEVVGARLEGNRYKLWCLMREEARPEGD